MISVLVISAEVRIGSHLRSVLGSQGWWVTTALDREQAVRAAADQQPGLVIVDCEVDGAAELVRTFGAKNGGPGVLLLEAPGDDGAFHAFEAGADRILSKPPRARALLEAAEQVMSLPHQSAGMRTAVAGEKLSATEIFGEVLLELDTTEPGTTRSNLLQQEAERPSEGDAPAESTGGHFGEPIGEEETAGAPPDLESAGAEAFETEEASPAEGSEAPPEERGAEGSREAEEEPAQSAEPAAMVGDEAVGDDAIEDREDSSLGLDPTTLGAEFDEIAVGASEEASLGFDPKSLGAEFDEIVVGASEEATLGLDPPSLGAEVDEIAVGASEEAPLGFDPPSLAAEVDEIAVGASEEASLGFDPPSLAAEVDEIAVGASEEASLGFDPPSLAAEVDEIAVGASEEASLGFDPPSLAAEVDEIAVGASEEASLGFDPPSLAAEVDEIAVGASEEAPLGFDPPSLGTEVDEIAVGASEEASLGFDPPSLAAEVDEIAVGASEEASLDSDPPSLAAEVDEIAIGASEEASLGFDPPSLGTEVDEIAVGASEEASLGFDPPSLAAEVDEIAVGASEEASLDSDPPSLAAEVDEIAIGASEEASLGFDPKSLGTEVDEIALGASEEALLGFDPPSLGTEVDEIAVGASEEASLGFDPPSLAAEVDEIEVGASEEAPLGFDPKTLGAEIDEIALGAWQGALAPVESDAAPVAGPDQPGSSRETLSRPSRPEPPAGEKGRFGQYRLDERIAVGGMAEVWRASMLGMEGFRKTVAIKKILPHLAENDEFVTMFIEEAKLAAQLSHENLVEIYDLGKIGESFFIAMEYVDGKDLRGLLNRLRQTSDQMPIGLALLIASEVARGLEYAHTREDAQGRALDLVHRDVSPRNVLIGHDGRVRLCDFGVAKAVSSVVQTQIGALKGKLQYMSPEQASGRPVDKRSDIYSLGSVMYEMILGRRLYEEDNEISLLDAARAGNFDDPRKHSPGLPEEVRRILIKALAKRPSSRYQSAGALEQELRNLARTLEPPPGAQTLGNFVLALFAERDSPEEGMAAPEGAFISVATTVQDEPSAATRILETRRPSMSRKMVRFWWGVLAGLLAAGLGAALLKLLLG